MDDIWEEHNESFAMQKRCLFRCPQTGKRCFSRTFWGKSLFLTLTFFRLNSIRLLGIVMWKGGESLCRFELSHLRNKISTLNYGEHALVDQKCTIYFPQGSLTKSCLQQTWQVDACRYLSNLMIRNRIDCLDWEESRNVCFPDAKRLKSWSETDLNEHAMCVYMMCMCAYVSTCASVHVFMWMCVCIHVCVHLCVFVNVCIIMCMCILVCKKFHSSFAPSW